jgi:GTPase SAR1 family protein
MDPNADNFVDQEARYAASQARSGLRRTLRRALGDLVGDMFTKREINYIIRVGIIGQPGSGKTRMIENLVRDRDRLNVGVGVNWRADAFYDVKDRKPTYRPTVKLQGSVSFHHLPGLNIPVQIIDTMGGLTVAKPGEDTFTAEQKQRFQDALRMLDMLVLVVDPDTVFSDNSEVLQAHLAEHVSTVLSNRPFASVVLAYTKCDAYGIQYSSTGRLLQAEDRASLMQLANSLRGAAPLDTTLSIPGLIDIDRRFTDPAEADLVRELLRRTEQLWRSVLQHAPEIPWQFNAYLVAADPALPKDARPKVSHGVGFDVAMNDFFGRVKQPWWPYWDAAPKSPR